MDQLALVTLIRQELSGQDVTPDIGEIIANTPLVDVVFSILAESDIMPYLKLEAGWILTNLAYGSEDELKTLIEYGGHDGKPSFVQIMTQMLESNDLVMIDQIMFLFGNITGTSSDLRATIRVNFDLTKLIKQLMTLSTLPKIFIKNYVWVASNLAEDSQYLEKEDIRNLIKILGEFLEIFRS
jgi:hypothetical protein